MERDKKGTIKNIAKTICFLLVFLLVFQALQYVLQPKWIESGLVYERVKLFYEEEPAPDVVFIGASHMYLGFSPLQLFQEQGIASYDFGAGGGGMDGYYLFVKEAIREKHPRLIVIEGWNMLTLMTGEDTVRRFYDPVPLSVSKIREVSNKLKNDREYDLGHDYPPLLTFLFPLLRYHDRWKELKPYDFNGVARNGEIRISGFSGWAHYHGGTHNYLAGNAVANAGDEYKKYNDPVKFKEAELKLAKEEFDKTVALCRESGTELLICKVPSPKWRQDYHDMLASWTEEYSLPFLDMNEDLDGYGIDLETDFFDANHTNDNGAVKVSAGMGEYLRAHYELPDRRGDPAYADWDFDWQVYQHDKAAYYLAAEKDWTAYLQKLQDPEYTVFIAARDNLGGERHPELTEQLKTLGLTPELDTAADTGYIAILDGGEVIYEELRDASLSYSGKVNGHLVSLISENRANGNSASILLDGVERFVNRRGVGLVVYDKVLGDVVDKVTFDLLDGGKCYR